MQLSNRLKQCRIKAGWSQDELAKRVFVTRQTISNWECGKTYPDVQSLLLLSEQFGITIDDLVKGDAAEIKEAIERDRDLLNRLGAGMLIGLVAFTASMAWIAWQQKDGWETSHLLPTAVLACLFGALALGCAFAAERVKKKRDLVTYQEISDFLDGKLSAEKDVESTWGRSHPNLSNFLKFVAAALLGLIVSVIVNGAIG